jgi:hypothetical protein
MATKTTKKKSETTPKCKTSGPLILGHEMIYPPQQRVGATALGIILANEKPGTLNRRSPFILLQPQSGKTGVIEVLINDFIDDCVARNRTFQIIVFCGLSLRSLTEQTRNRLTAFMTADGCVQVGARLNRKADNTGLVRLPGALLSDGLVILHNSPKLRQLNLNIPVDVRLWIGDEAHLGNVKDGNIDLMLKNHGVYICEQIHTWDNSRTVNHFVGVSATPSAHMLKSDNLPLEGEALFHWIYEPPPPNYNSLAKMRANGRLRPTQPLFLKNNSHTAFLTHILAEWQSNCVTLGPGYLLIRAMGKKHARLMNYLNRKGRQIEYTEFDSEKGNIDRLTDYLSIKPAEPTIVVIRGSMRAGITLGSDHHIRGWVETESITSDTQVQAGVGRACGYGGRSLDTYPIYCDLDKVDEWIEAYDKLDNGETPTIPSGIQSRPLKAHVYYPVKEVLPYQKAYDKYIKPFRDLDKEDKRDDKRSDTDRMQRYRRQFSSTTRNVLTDVADLFLGDRPQRDSGSTVGLHIDGPTSDKAAKACIAKHSKSYTPEQVWEMVHRNRASYKKLLQELAEQYPDVNFDVGKNAKGEPEGKVLVFKINELKFNGPDGKQRIRTTGEKVLDLNLTRDDLQRRTSAVKKPAKK